MPTLRLPRSFMRLLVTTAVGLTAGTAVAQTTPPPTPDPQQPPPAQPQTGQPQYPQPQYPQQPQYPPGYPQQPQYPQPQYPPQQPQYPQPQYPQPQYPPPSSYGRYPTPAPQYPLPPEPEPRIHRRGLAIGLGLGGGNVHYDNGSQGGLAFSFDIGGVLNEHLAILFDYSTVTYDVNDQRESHSVFGGVAQIFFARFLWAKAGLGLGQLSAEDRYGNTIDATERSLAAIAAVGGEVLQTTGGFALDLQLRFVGSSYHDAGATTSTSLLIGLNFY